MTGQTNKKADKILSAYYDYIGEYHLENICDDIETQEDEIDALKFPESIDVWFSQYIDKIRKKEARVGLQGKIKTIFLRAAVILLILFVSMSFVVISVDAIRMKVYNLLIESHEKYTAIGVEELMDVPEDWYNFYYPAYIPEGFQVQRADGSGKSKVVKFSDSADGYIIFSQAPLGTNFQLDTENSTKKEIQIRSYTALLFEKPGKNIIFWNNEEYCFYLISNKTTDIIVRIAESIDIK